MLTKGRDMWQTKLVQWFKQCYTGVDELYGLSIVV